MVDGFPLWEIRTTLGKTQWAQVGPGLLTECSNHIPEVRSTIIKPSALLALQVLEGKSKSIEAVCRQQVGAMSPGTGMEQIS